MDTKTMSKSAVAAMEKIDAARSAQPDRTGLSCAFPSPAPRAQYCHPAPYSQTNGQRYHNLTQAYGQSRRVQY